MILSTGYGHYYSQDTTATILFQEGLKVCTLIEELGKFSTCLLEIEQGPWKLHQGSGSSILILILIYK